MIGGPETASANHRAPSGQLAPKREKMLVTDLRAEFYDVIKSQVSDAVGSGRIMGTVCGMVNREGVE